MKKHTLFLFAFAFIISLFNVNIGLLNATTTATVSDCVITNTLRKGSAGAEVVCLQTRLGLSADGKFGPKTKASVVAFQTSNNLVPDGIVGPKSRTVLQGTISTKINPSCPTYPPLPPDWCAGGTIVPQGLDANGCQKLPKCVSSINTKKININPENATIKFGATTTLQAFLSTCGELACVTNSSAVRAEWTTSNSQIAKVEYKNTCPPGAYCFAGPDLFTAVVTGVSQGTATITATYKNSSSENTLTANALITVGGTESSSITVTSPNGGETWVKGTNKTIYWQSDKVAQYDIFLAPYQAPCTAIICPMSMMVHAPYVVARNIYSSTSNFQGSYTWPVGAVQDLWDAVIPDGSYKIQVCQSGINICDSSDSYFSIASNTSAPTISSLSPASGAVNTVVKITGTGFLATGNTVSFMGYPMCNLSKNSDGTLSFTVPSFLPSYSPCAPKTPGATPSEFTIIPGVYPVIVSNANGASNSLNFTVTTN